VCALALIASLDVQRAKAAAVSFINTAPITIPSSGVASPYPASVDVSAAGLGSLSGASVSLNGLSHTAVNEVGAVLVGPRGQAMLVMFCAGGGNTVTNLNLLLSDVGPALPTTPLSSGTFRPTANDCGIGLPSFPAPGPGTAYANPGPLASGSATLSGTFGGTNPDGTWFLYVADFNGGNSGTIASGWSLTLTTTPPDTTITRRPKAKTRSRKATLAFSSSAPGATFQCSLDGGPFAACGSPLKRKVSRGRHNFLVRAVDSSGAVDSSEASASWRVLKPKKRKK